MSEETVNKFLAAVGKTAINIVTLKPILKKWFSFKGLIYTWIAVQLYWLIHNLYLIGTNGFDYESTSLLEIISRLNLISIVSGVAQIGVLLYLLKIYQFYAIGVANQKLDIAKSLGIISSSEHQQKLLFAQKIQYIEEVTRMYEAGIFNLEQKNDLEKMAEHRYELRIKQIALQKALESGVISDDEFKQKSKALSP